MSEPRPGAAWTVIRPMTGEDLDAVAAVTNAAFATRRAGAGGRAPTEAAFPALLLETRLAADPEGCLVAVSEQAPSRVLGALTSSARGTLGWFGPLAVHPGAQRAGIGARLVAACLEGWRRRGVRMTGLETIGDSPFHVRFYTRLGFRPSWTGIRFSVELAETEMPAGVEVDGALPDLDFLYRGLDLADEAAATIRSGAGHVLTTEGGLAVLHVERTLQSPEMGFVPFLAAVSRDAFGRLLGAAEHLSREAGRRSLLARTSGSSWSTLDALDERGYRAGEVMVRMKAGEDLDYDARGSYYLDSWL